MINIREEGIIAVSPYVKHFHGRLEMSFTVTTIIRGIINAELSRETKNSKAEAYLVYIKLPIEYYIVLKTVKITNPQARCLFIFNEGSYDEAVERLQFAWKHYEMFNIVIASINKQFKLVWCMYNPFNEMHYNLAASTRVEMHLSDLRELNNFNGFPVAVRFCWLHLINYY